MKKFTKIMFIVSVICIVFGLALMVATGLTGDLYYANAYRNLGIGEMDINDFPADLASMVDGTGKWMEEELEAKFETVTDRGEVDLQPEAIAGTQVHELEIAVKAASLEIIRDNSMDEIMITDVSEYVECKYSSDEEKIQLLVQRKEKYKRIGNIGDASVTLIIPADMRFREVVIELDAASLDVQGLSAEEMGLVLNAASAEVIDLDVDVLEVDNNTSSLSIGGDVTGMLDVECNAGEVDLSLKGVYEDFQYELNSKAGAIQVDEYDYSGLKEEVFENWDESKKKAKLESNVGSIQVQFYD